ncbi:MAG: potassium-transporting ATPase subunit KdpC [Myxococcaceae bacterium]|nr:potassium-transporting ATPase subunit KdpC [Myxococcaceae bacterium]
MGPVFRPAVVVFTFLTVVTGVLYPACVTGAARVLFPGQAQGSLITVDGRVVGSELVGQPFSGEAFLWGRPSATAPIPYNAAASTGSNLGPLNPALADAVRARIAVLRDAGVQGPIPVDLVTASGSGLDPDVSVAAALAQVDRVARARQRDPAAVRALVERFVVRPPLHPPTVNVLALNRALGEDSPR